MPKRFAMAVLLAGMLSVGESTAQPAADAVPNETVCAQGTYSLPCPKVIWCPADKCGVAVARPDGLIDIVFSSEEQMRGTRRRPIQAKTPMTLQSIAGRVFVFEWVDSGDMQTPDADLPIKTIHYVIMPPQTNG
jgi:hypothetical protein